MRKRLDMLRAVEISNRKTLVFYLHGLRGHAYAQHSALKHIRKHVGARLISLELPGHGAESSSKHCLVPKYELLTEQIVATIKAHSSDAEQIILMGYSFGGALMSLAAQSLERDAHFSSKVVGLVGISTALSVDHNVPRWQIWMAGLIAPLSRSFYNRVEWARELLTIRKMNIELISPDPLVRESIASDDLMYKGRIPLHTSAQVYYTSLSALRAIDHLRCDVLLVHSKDDEIAAAPHAGLFTKKVRLSLFETLRHNCIDGRTREAVAARRQISEFLQSKL